MAVTVLLADRLFPRSLAVIGTTKPELSGTVASPEPICRPDDRRVIVTRLRPISIDWQRYWTFASSRLASLIPSGSSSSTVRFSRTKTPQAAKSAAAPTATDAARGKSEGSV